MSENPGELFPELERTQQPDPKANLLEADFEAWWKLYPRNRRDDKPRCKRMYLAARDEGVTHLEMVDGIGKWMSFWRRDQTEAAMIPLAPTWLSKQRWSLEPPAPAARSRQQNLMPEFPASPSALAKLRAKVGSGR